MSAARTSCSITPNVEQLLGFLATRLPALKPVRLADKSMRQRGLADAGLPGQQDDTRMTRANVGGLRQQGSQLMLAPDERGSGSTRIVEI